MYFPRLLYIVFNAPIYHMCLSILKNSLLFNFVAICPKDCISDSLHELKSLARHDEWVGYDEGILHMQLPIKAPLASFCQGLHNSWRMLKQEMPFQLPLTENQCHPVSILNNSITKTHMHV